MKGVAKCAYCGFNFESREANLAKFNGKRYHVGCLRQKTLARKKTLEILAQTRYRRAN